MNRTAAFDEAVQRALRALDGDATRPVVDSLSDGLAGRRAVGALERACAKGSPDAGARTLLLRVGADLGPVGAAYGPDPSDPWWLRLRAGDPEVRLAPLRDGEAASRRAAAVAVEEAPLRCCDAPSCENRRVHRAVWLELEAPAAGAGGGASAASIPRVLVAEERPFERPVPASPPPAATSTQATATALARALGIPLRAPGAEPAVLEAASAEPATDREGDEATGRALPAAALARYALRSEADRVVLRDLENVGPRAASARTTAFGLAVLGVALLFWAGTVRAALGGTTAVAIGLGAAAVLLTVGGYTFVSIGRFGARYRALSAPLVWVGRDRLVVAPWVSRTGSIDLRPEGRFGAAIPIGEVHGLAVKPCDGGFAVELDTEHGPIHAMVAESEEVATYWCEALRRAIDSVRHPDAKATAKQRARAKGHAEPRPA